MLHVSYDGLSFLTGSRVWCSSVKIDVKHFAGAGETYFIRWQNPECYMFPREERVKFYLKVRGWWKKYEQCRGLHASTSPLFSYFLGSFFNDSPLREGLYRVVVANHCVMVIMAFLQWFGPSNDFMKMNPVGLVTRMREDVYKVVLLPLLDAVVRFVFEAGEGNISARTRFSRVLDHVALFHSSKID